MKTREKEQEECLEFLNSLRYTRVELRKLFDYERDFILRRAKEEGVKGMDKALEEVIKGELNFRSVKPK